MIKKQTSQPVNEQANNIQKLQSQYIGQGSGINSIQSINSKVISTKKKIGSAYTSMEATPSNAGKKTVGPTPFKERKVSNEYQS